MTSRSLGFICVSSQPQFGSRHLRLRVVFTICVYNQGFLFRQLATCKLTATLFLLPLAVDERLDNKTAEDQATLYFYIRIGHFLFSSTDNEAAILSGIQQHWTSRPWPPNFFQLVSKRGRIYRLSNRTGM